jgi:hypothetical protein
VSTRPPVQPHRQQLPFRDSAFGWDTFEDFFCDFLNAQPVITISEAGKEIRQRVIRARPYGRKGDNQHGIDLIAEMEGGETWEFQCKHYKTWGPEQTRRAIGTYERSATRKFLLVTRETSEECFEVVASHEGWALWDSREIDRRFREIERAKGAEILFTHFGPEWAETYFGIPGNSPFIGAGAKFERQLVEGHRFHHRHELIGRADVLEELDGFVQDEKSRVFLLTGRGGLGKSRLLLQWSRNFNQRHSNHTLRFLSDKCSDFGASLRGFSQPLTLVFDDAHRLDEVRRALFHELPCRTQVKLVLALRPGPLDQVMRELHSAGFDSTEISRPKEMTRLSAEQTMTLVDKALRPEFSRHRQFLLAASRDCPLIAVIGAELINSGALATGDLIDEKELQSRVFQSLLNDANQVRAEFGHHETDDFLRLLALLGPLKLDADFFAKAAPFLGIPQADRLSRLRDAVDSAGLLHVTGAGCRVTPDLLSDHLAYTACYDDRGQSRTFAERILKQFSPGEFPRLMQHLAEAEWRALDELPNATSVVEPLWRWFRKRFEDSSFYQRNQQIQEWANIAHLQPDRSLELARLAIGLTTAPAPKDECLWMNEWNTHEHSLEGLPKMIAGIAEHHPSKVAICFDLLWQLGRDKPIDGNWNTGHAISLMADVIGFKVWKSVEVSKAALSWLDRHLDDDEWTKFRHAPGAVLTKVLEPVFAATLEENWSTGRTFYMRTHPVHLGRTTHLREHALNLCRRLLAQKDNQLAIQLIPLLDHGCDLARFAHSGAPTERFFDDWDVERMKSLAVLGEILRDYSEPLIHLLVRRLLLRHLRYGKDRPAFQAACRKLLRSVPDSIEFQIARCAFGNHYEEFEGNTRQKDWIDVAKARWEKFIGKAATASRDAVPDIQAWLDYFGALDQRWRAFEGFSPDFRDLFRAVGELHPKVGISVAELLLAEPTHCLVGNFDTIVLASTKSDPDRRLRLVLDGISSEGEPLQRSAIATCCWWRSSGDLPDKAVRAIEALAPDASPGIADSIVSFTWFNQSHGSLRDWSLLASLPFSPADTHLASRIAQGAADLIVASKLHPNDSSVAQFLSRFEAVKDLGAGQLERALSKLAEAFPEEVFLMLWRRNNDRKSGNESLNPLPYDFGKVRFPRIMSSPKVRAIVAELEGRLASGEELDHDEIRLLRSAIHHGSEDPSARLESAAGRATSGQQLKTLLELGSVGSWSNAALAFPGFARALLKKSRSLGGDIHRELFSQMIHVAGGRGTTNGELDPDWKALLERMDALTQEFVNDRELGPLYDAIRNHERSWSNSMRLRNHEIDDGWDD